MDTKNWRPTSPGGELTMDTGDWRTQLEPDSRQRIVKKIIDTLKRHLPFSGPEGLNELRKIAERFEEKIFTAASNQMLTMENKSQNNVPNPGSNSKPSDPGFGGITSSVTQPFSMQSTPLPGLGQNQQSSLQQSVLQQPQPLQQPHIIGQQTSAANIEQNQSIDQSNNIVNIQHQLQLLQLQHQPLQQQQSTQYFTNSRADIAAATDVAADVTDAITVYSAATIDVANAISWRDLAGMRNREQTPEPDFI
ncbi:hypothetical protein PTKIN_Ptkin13bG0140200 [Pterospermum kingtungense]